MRRGAGRRFRAAPAGAGMSAAGAPGSSGRCSAALLPTRAAKHIQYSESGANRRVVPRCWSGTHARGYGKAASPRVGHILQAVPGRSASKHFRKVRSRGGSRHTSAVRGAWQASIHARYGAGGSRFRSRYPSSRTGGARPAGMPADTELGGSRSRSRHPSAEPGALAGRHGCRYGAGGSPSGRGILQAGVRSVLAGIARGRIEVPDRFPGMGWRRLDSCRFRACNQQPDSFRHGPGDRSCP